MAERTTRHRIEQQEHFERRTSWVERLVKHTAVARTMRKKLAFIASELKDCESILEIGTGHGVELGSLLDHLQPGARYYGVDLATTPLRNAVKAVPDPQRGTTSFAAALVEHLPFADASFDGVFCIDVLHHAESQGAMLAELKRVLKPRGKVLCVEPNPLFPVNVIFIWNKLENGLFKLTPSNARTWIDEAGLVEGQLLSLPIYFPSFPALLSRPYDAAEQVIGAIPGVRSVSTTRILSARRSSGESLDA